MKQSVLMVDDNMANLKIGKGILSDIYNVYTVLTAEKMFELLTKAMPDIILLDIEMPGMDGMEAIGRLKSDETLKNIPVIFLTSRSDGGSELKGLSLGAVDYISKPFSPALLRKRLELHLLMAEQTRLLQEYKERYGAIS
ncbi:hypothetical protein FACS1894217_00920 [Clostridia bacterium]|nr:hypothetical protein FACS1894217_00920 [Clostridia bacterium]